MQSFNCLCLDVSVHSYRFYADTTPYVDIHYRAIAYSIQYVQTKNNKLKAGLNVLITFTNQSNQNIEAFEKYILNSPLLDTRMDLIDQKRFFLHSGNYLLKIKIVDENDSLNFFNYEKKINIQPFKKNSFSDIMLITKAEKKSDNNSMHRSGVYLETFPFDVVNESQQIINFYAEYYHDAEALINMSIVEGIEPNDTCKIVFSKVKKISTEPVSIIFNQFDLNKLPSGNYHLKLSIIDKNKNIIHSNFASFVNRNLPADIALKRDFNKEFSNSFVQNLDSLKVNFSLRALLPHHSNNKASLLHKIIKNENLTIQKYFLYHYWKENYGHQMQANYEAYMKVAEFVDKQFYSTVGQGIMTDRAYVFLKYGRPNKIITIEDEANTPPYEIWFYDNLDKTLQTNVRFIFWSPLLANEFDLLHSTCYGERQNERWEVTLYKNSPNERKGTTSSFDAVQMQENFNRKARKLFESQ